MLSAMGNIKEILSLCVRTMAHSRPRHQAQVSFRLQNIESGKGIELPSS
jgi:hypothetical protein